MLAIITPIKTRLAALAPLAGWDVRTELDEDDTSPVPAVDIRGSGASATDSESAGVTLDPSYTVTLAVKRGATAAAQLDAALQAVIGSLHNWRPGVVVGTSYRRVALQGIRSAEFSSAGVVAYQLVFSTSAVYHGHPTGATP